MTFPVILFAAGCVLGALGVTVSARRTAVIYGRTAAAKEAAVTSASVAAYAAITLWLGFGWGQVLACLVSAVVLVLGWHWIPSITELVKGDDGGT